MSETNDHPGVVAPPPLIALAGIALGFLLDWLVPAYVLDTVLSPWIRGFFGGVLLTAGVALAIEAAARFREAGTSVNPWTPSRQLATAGVFQYLRNPMYAGLLLIVGGVGIAFASDWTLVMVVPVALILHHGVVLREERYLEARFGDSYRRYKDRVPRWGVF
ncbi:MAG: isoprenylcysteine carboxylmethyltransferase family protein [Rhizobiales bacterium]|jgi:protein-S-isoprenylcysteine O-methyltransferase Ste14|nr:isoprenylcysteine carboxylmethyltransferase family protein [Hyphomicrobiales bacterium]